MNNPTYENTLDSAINIPRACGREHFHSAARFSYYAEALFKIPRRDPARHDKRPRKHTHVIPALLYTSNYHFTARDRASGTKRQTNVWAVVRNRTRPVLCGKRLKLYLRCSHFFDVPWNVETEMLSSPNSGESSGVWRVVGSKGAIL